MRLRYPSWYVLLLALAWPAAVLSVFSVFALAFVLVVVVHALLQRRFGLAALAAGASPFGVACLAGAAMYFAGTATIASPGNPSTDTAGLDPQSRAPLSEAQAKGSGHEWVWRWSSTLGVRTMAAAFGPMPGSYDGAFPRSTEARDVLDAATEPAMTTRGAVIVDGQAHPLQPETVAWLDQCFDPWLTRADVRHTNLWLRGGLTDDGVLVVGDSRATVMIDPDKGLPFSTHGTFSCAEPPPRWEPVESPVLHIDAQSSMLHAGHQPARFQLPVDR
ncbi:MAG: hypothetical protein AAF799_30945 [Myxococcota bacterium]